MTTCSTVEGAILGNRRHVRLRTPCKHENAYACRGLEALRAAVVGRSNTSPYADGRLLDARFCVGRSVTSPTLRFSSVRGVRKHMAPTSKIVYYPLGPVSHRAPLRNARYEDGHGPPTAPGARDPPPNAQHKDGPTALTLSAGSGVSPTQLGPCCHSENSRLRFPLTRAR